MLNERRNSSTQKHYQENMRYLYQTWDIGRNPAAVTNYSALSIEWNYVSCVIEIFYLALQNSDFG